MTDRRYDEIIAGIRQTNSFAPKQLAVPFVKKKKH